MLKVFDDQLHVRARQWMESSLTKLHGKVQEGDIADAEMFRTFNMGIGMVIIMAEGDAEKAMQLLADCKLLGQITEGSGVDLQL